MPTYEYACKACRERLEVVQSFSDAALTECPSCGGDLRKVFSPVGIAFKGSGFYKNDSRGSKKSATANGSAASESKSESKSDSTGESKSDSKGESKPDSKGESKPAAKTPSDSPSSSSSTSRAAS